MAQRKYEIMFLLDSGKFATDPDGVVSQVNTILDKVGAEVVAARPWMDGKLAYEIEGHRKGTHYLAYVTADSLKMQDLARHCKLSEVVLRHLCILPPDQLFDLMANALENPEADVEDAPEGESSEAADSETADSEAAEADTEEKTATAE